MADHILDLLNDVESTFIAREVPEPVKNPLSLILPDVTQEGTEAEIVKGTVKYSIAQFRAFDAEAPIGKRDAELVSSTLTLPPLSQKLPLNEKLIRKLQESATDATKDAFIKRTFDDVLNNTIAIRNRVEKARGEFLSTGKVVIDENGVKETFDFGLDVSHKPTASVLWSDPTADIISDERAWIELVADDALVEPSMATVPRALMAYLQKNASYKAAIYPGQSNAPTLTPDQVNQVRAMYDLPVLNVYTGKVPGAAGTTNVLPQDVYILTTDTVGDTRWGETTEAMELSNSNAVDFSAEDRPGITVNSWKVPDPVTRWTKAAAVVLPVAQDINGLLVAKVL